MMKLARNSKLTRPGSHVIGTRFFFLIKATFVECRKNSTSSIKRVIFVKKIMRQVQRDVQTWRMGRPKVLNITGAAPRLSLGWWYLHVDPYLHVPVLRKYCNTYFEQEICPTTQVSISVADCGLQNIRFVQIPYATVL